MPGLGLTGSSSPTINHERASRRFQSTCKRWSPDPPKFRQRANGPFSRHAGIHNCWRRIPPFNLLSPTLATYAAGPKAFVPFLFFSEAFATRTQRQGVPCWMGCLPRPNGDELLRGKLQTALSARHGQLEMCPCRAILRPFEIAESRRLSGRPEACAAGQPWLPRLAASTLLNLTNRANVTEKDGLNDDFHLSRLRVIVPGIDLSLKQPQ